MCGPPGWSSWRQSRSSDGRAPSRYSAHPQCGGAVGHERTHRASVPPVQPFELAGGGHPEAHAATQLW